LNANSSGLATVVVTMFRNNVTLFIQADGPGYAALVFLAEPINQVSLDEKRWSPNSGYWLLVGFAENVEDSGSRLAQSKLIVSGVDAKDLELTRSNVQAAHNKNGD
jgi:hypothetical protein